MWKSYSIVDATKILFGFLFLSSLVLSVVSPLIAFYYSLSLLVLFPKEFSNKFLRGYISVIAIVNACLVFSSRTYLQSNSDDFSHYYMAYISILNGGGLDQYANGLEFLISAYFKIIIILFDKLPIPDIFLCVSLLSVSVFYIWLETCGLEDIEEDKKSLCVASCLAFFMYALSTQLMRQMIATPFLLFALSYGLKNIKGRIFLILAIGGHLSSLPLYFVLKTFMGDNRKAQYSILGAFVFFGFLFAVLLNHLSIFVGLPVVGELFAKLQYYNAISLRSNAPDSSNTFLKYLIVMLAAYLFFGQNRSSEFKKLFYFSCVSYIVLIPIPLLSSRVFLIMSGVGLGYFMFHAFYRLSFVYRMLLLLYFAVRIITLGPAYVPKFDGFDLWYSYPWIYFTL